MNRKNNIPRNAHDNTQKIQAGQPSAYPQATGETTVTQITPDDVVNAEGPIKPATKGGTPTQEQLEQDVITVNPSVDSMESRG